VDHTLHGEYYPNLAKLTNDLALLANAGHAYAVPTTGSASIEFERDPLVPASPAVSDISEPARSYINMITQVNPWKEGQMQGLNIYENYIKNNRTLTFTSKPHFYDQITDLKEKASDVAKGYERYYNDNIRICDLIKQIELIRSRN